MLVRIEPKKIYALEEFEQSQTQYQYEARAKLLSLFDSIFNNLTNTFEIFRNDGAGVFSQWVKFIEGIDTKIEQALRVTVKKSLSEISKAINGDTTGNLEIQSLFSINVVLASQKVEFNPSFTKLQEIITQISRKMIFTTSTIPRLVTTLTTLQLPTFYDLISSSDETIRFFSSLSAGLQTNSQKCQLYLHNWDTYKDLWELNKDAFIRRYAKLKPSLSTFDADINRYNQVGINALKEENLVMVGFVVLDLTNLKHSIVEHCSAWQSKLTTLLNQNAYGEMNGVLDGFVRILEQLKVLPRDLEEFRERIEFIDEVKRGYPKIQSQFGLIKEMYSILETYEVEIKDEERVKLQGLVSSIKELQKQVDIADLQLQECKVGFRNEVLREAEEYNSLAKSIKEQFNNQGPFLYSLGVDLAMKSIQEFRMALNSALTQEMTVKKGLQVFKIEHVPSKDYEIFSNDLELLDQVWTIVQEWLECFEAWSAIQFLELDVNGIDETVLIFERRILQVGDNAQNWNVFAVLKDKIAAVRCIVPILTSLRNPAILDHHWKLIEEKTGKSFSIEDPDFTFDSIFAAGLDQHWEAIASILTDAMKDVQLLG
jgi:dynein heavy chain, axonemal